MSGGIDLKFNEYRHIMQAFGEKLIVANNDFNFKLEVLNSQIGHSVQTGSLHYAKSQMDINSIKRTTLSNYEDLSHQWHLILNLRPTIDRAKSEKQHDQSNHTFETPVQPIINQTCIMFSDQTYSSSDKLTIKYPTNALGNGKDLSRLLNCLITDFGCKDFLSYQQSEAMLAVINRSKDVLVILPTGGGKTNVCLVPVKIESLKGMKTVVIVPLICLKSQFAKNCNDAKITHCFWSPDLNLHNATDVIIVSVEMAIKESFRNFCNRLHNMGTLSRIVVDECHTAKTWQTYRDCFLQLRCIRTSPVPLVLLSATIPPNMEAELRIFYGSNFFTIRQTTARWNIRYEVKYLFDMNEIQSNLLDIIKETNVSVVVFVLGKDEALLINDLLLKKHIRSNWYTSDIDENERCQIIEAYRKEDIQVIVATSAFSMGIDLPNVGCVIHIKHSWSMIDFIQECGRAGRGHGTVARCVTLTTKDSIANCRDVNLKAYLESTTLCRRSILHEYVDGKSVYCLQNSKSSLCDVCRPSNDQQFANFSVPENSLDKQMDIMSSLETDVLLTEDWLFQCDRNAESDLGLKSPILSPLLTQPKSSQSKLLNDMTQIQTFNTSPQLQSIVDCPSINAPVKPITLPPNQLPQALRMKLLIDNEETTITNVVSLLNSIKNYGCIVCNWDSRKRSTHDLLSCQRFRDSKKCVKCFDKHAGKKCCFRLLTGLCFLCGLPGKALNTRIHQADGGYGNLCSLNLADVIIPISWISWRAKKKILVSEIPILASFYSDQLYFEWMVKKEYFGLPNMCRIVMIAVTKNWIVSLELNSNNK